MAVVRLAVVGPVVRSLTPQVLALGTAARVDCGTAVPYTTAIGEHRMTLFAKIFTTKTLLQIVFVLAATVMMKAISAHYDFSWATALAQG
jgi:hypothetical protein